MKISIVLTSRESLRYLVIPSSIERRKRLRPYSYHSLSIFMTYTSTVESIGAT